MNGVEPQDLVKGTTPFSRWIRRMQKDNMANRDTIVALDATSGSRFGAVGDGKTCNEIQILLALNPGATLARNLVVVDDWDHYKELLEDKTWYLPIAVDEAEHFWYKRTFGRKGQVERILTYMSNRKERKYTLGTLPRIWDMDIFMRNTRIMWRLKTLSRGRAQLFVRNSPSQWEEKKDLWGKFVTTFEDIPDLPEYVWNEYYRCLEQYVPEYDDKDRYVRTVGRAKELT